jgi:hypothetical protein
LTAAEAAAAGAEGVAPVAAAEVEVGEEAVPQPGSAHLSRNKLFP